MRGRCVNCLQQAAVLQSDCPFQSYMRLLTWLLTLLLKILRTRKMSAANGCNRAHVNCTLKYSPLSHMGDSTVSFFFRCGATSAIRSLSCVMLSYGSCLPTYCSNTETVAPLHSYSQRYNNTFSIGTSGSQADLRLKTCNFWLERALNGAHSFQLAMLVLKAEGRRQSIMAANKSICPCNG